MRSSQRHHIVDITDPSLISCFGDAAGAADYEATHRTANQGNGLHRNRPGGVDLIKQPREAGPIVGYPKSGVVANRHGGQQGVVLKRLCQPGFFLGAFPTPLSLKQPVD